MANKRQKKKALKKSLGYSERERITKEELLKEQQKQKKRTKRKAAEWKKQQKKNALQNRYERKIQKFIDAGFKRKDAEKLVGPIGKQKSFAWVDNYLNWEVKKTGSTCLYIGFAEIENGFHVEDLSGISNEDLIEMIQQRIEEASLFPDDSSSFAGAFKVFVGSIEDCRIMAKAYYRRGYNLSSDGIKFDGRTYSTISISNTFSRREFLEMVYNCITQMRNDEVSDFMFQMRKFDNKNNFGFLEGIKIEE